MKDFNLSEINNIYNEITLENYLKEFSAKYPGDTRSIENLKWEIEWERKHRKKITNEEWNLFVEKCDRSPFGRKAYREKREKGLE